MYKILIAGPDGRHPNFPMDMNVETSAFFTSGRAVCLSSVDPEDLEDCDGVAVPGGLPDIDPAYWGETNYACHAVDPEMDRQQMAMIRRAVQLGKPIIGFCRGYQLVSVYFGADMIQDIRCQAAHRYEPGAPRFHEIINVPGTFLYDLYGGRMRGNSAHHQALRKLPDCLRISQIWCENEEKRSEYLRLAQEGRLEGSGECIIEAVYHVNYPFIGLQWHPELGGELCCKHLDCSKIRDYFYDMMKRAKT